MAFAFLSDSFERLVSKIDTLEKKTDLLICDFKQQYVHQIKVFNVGARYLSYLE
jgi:hypothetical protein